MIPNLPAVVILLTVLLQLGTMYAVGRARVAQQPPRSTLWMPNHGSEYSL